MSLWGDGFAPRQMPLLQAMMNSFCFLFVFAGSFLLRPGAAVSD